MSFNLLNIFKKKEIDPILSLINTSHYKKFQDFINRLLTSVNIWNETSRINHEINHKFSMERYRQDKQNIEKIMLKFNTSSHYNPIILYLLYQQYLRSDPWTREDHARDWVNYLLIDEDAKFCPPLQDMLEVIISNFDYYKLTKEETINMFAYLASDKTIIKDIANDKKISLSFKNGIFNRV